MDNFNAGNFIKNVEEKMFQNDYPNEVYVFAHNKETSKIQFFKDSKESVDKIAFHQMKFDDFIEDINEDGSWNGYQNWGMTTPNGDELDLSQKGANMHFGYSGDSMYVTLEDNENYFYDKKDGMNVYTHDTIDKLELDTVTGEVLPRAEQFFKPGGDEEIYENSPGEFLSCIRYGGDLDLWKQNAEYINTDLFDKESFPEVAAFADFDKEAILNEVRKNQDNRVWVFQLEENDELRHYSMDAESLDRSLSEGGIMDGYVTDWIVADRNGNIIADSCSYSDLNFSRSGDTLYVSFDNDGRPFRGDSEEFMIDLQTKMHIPNTDEFWIEPDSDVGSGLDAGDFLADIRDERNFDFWQDHAEYINGDLFPKENFPEVHQFLDEIERDDMEINNDDMMIDEEEYEL